MKWNLIRERKGEKMVLKKVEDKGVLKIEELEKRMRESKKIVEIKNM